MKKSQQASLPVLIPPSVLRPIVFRIFTRKHSLSVTSASLETLARFVGSNCGCGWREQGLAELLLDEVARNWKHAGGGLIVEEVKEPSLHMILEDLGSRISNGRILPLPQNIPEHPMESNPKNEGKCHSSTEMSYPLDDRSKSIDLQGGVCEDNIFSPNDPRQWIRVVNAFDQPRLLYNMDKRNFALSPSSASVFPSSSSRIDAFRDRYNRVYQRVLRNSAFRQPSNVSRQSRQLESSTSSTNKGSYSLTFVSSLQGRPGTSHLLLGLLHLSPIGGFCLSDLTGSVALDLRFAKGVPEGETWFVPGMVLLVDGIYEEQTSSGPLPSISGGIGGNIGGRFVALSVAGPPCERRELSLETNSSSDHSSAPISGFGWTDFLGVGSRRAEGNRMRQIKQQCFETSSPISAHARTQIALMSDVNLNNPKTLQGLSNVLQVYNNLPIERTPLAFVLIGDFAQQAIMTGKEGACSVTYKGLFDRLAIILSSCSRLLQNSTFIFVPGDNDPWASNFCAGAAPPVPRGPIPDLFTSRVRRAFTVANAETQSCRAAHPGGEAIWTSNPARLSIFGPVQELVIFRDDISERLRRMALNFRDGSCQEPISAMPVGHSKNERHHDTYTDDMASDFRATAPDLERSRPTENNRIKENVGNVAARKLVKSILDQGHLSPFPTTTRAVFWDHASALYLYPLPTCLILADTSTGPFSVTYEGCHVLNPGKFVTDSAPNKVTWAEYDISTCKSCIREEQF
ncbi:DNA polymerase epsilon subunit B family protein [Coccidioides posadasii C735 delta SOWgp]|uniref:DNA polymerase epsilon subunit B n=1 Tax=Coccidioides posadasii (strain C735) TaxID=222929 RepID=C5P8F6_COCP7|nr:DNA polymerase epsilon subunit B family protein [Coccidioides posadasii C735 delta SOWgp]EER26018.1 DNA polymerase epsilon subunit B family protein [Coccidioides posadasii C735 delta SOWgp]|eukprot:XP_003068163.1 DNA polymerase epsilon subunit B family protein [Coccidioides posadasii C735 delta SOWgp]